jgi:eukaryotic-like serine/threonine-protein kinase
MPDPEPVTRPISPAVGPPAPEERPTGGHPEDAAPTQATEVTAQPQRLGRFAIIKTLGRGGMGVVYLARDARDKREVALKVIPAGHDADPTDLARFRTEAEAVERLDHPNIVKLYEVGEGDGIAWLAMEYVDGGSLYRRVKYGGLMAPDEAARLVEQIARATDFAHTHGVVHRDLKPSNILMQSPRSNGDGPGIPKLADFGLAKQLDKSLRLTQTGIAVGTPHYMAPEQARGQPDQIGPSVDIYALGVILYELLVGQPPFDGGTPMETMQRVVDRQPVPPSRLRPGIPPELEAICLKCLQKSPADRYRTARAVADDLQAFLAGDALRHATDPAMAAHTARRKSRWFAAALAVAAILLAAGVTWFVTTWVHGERTEAGERAQRRAQLESAVALCEAGHVSAGIEQMRNLESTAEADGLPVPEIIRAWEGRVLQPTPLQPNVVADVLAIGPKNELLAIAEGRSVRVAKIASRAPAISEWTVDATVAALGWSESGIHLAIATMGGKIFVGNVETGELASEPVLTRPNETILAVGFAFPGVRVIYGGDTIRQELAPPMRPRRPADSNRFDLPAGPFVAAAIAPGRGDVAAVLATGAVRIFDAADGQWRDLAPDGHASAISYSSDGNVLAVGTRSGSVRLWDAVARVPLTEAVNLGKPVTTVTVGEYESEYAAVACPKPGTDRASGATWRCGRPFVAPPIRLSKGPGREVLGVTFGTGGTSVYVTSPHGVSRWGVMDAKRYGPQRAYSADDRYGEPHGPQARFSAGTLSGNTLLVGGSGGRLFQISETAEKPAVTDAPGVKGGMDVTALACGPAGQTACAYKKGNDRAVARHWAAAIEGDPLDHDFDFDIHQETFLPDASAVVLACGDGKVRIWEPGRDHVRAELDCGSVPVLAVAVNENGSRLLAGCADGAARLWDLSANKELLIVRHRAEVRGVAFHIDDLLTASGDGTSRRWHGATGLPIGPAFAHSDSVNALAVWKDLVATGTRDRYVRIWRLP